MVYKTTSVYTSISIFNISVWEEKKKLIYKLSRMNLTFRWNKQMPLYPPVILPRRPSTPKNNTKESLKIYATGIFQLFLFRLMSWLLHRDVGSSPHWLVTVNTSQHVPPHPLKSHAWIENIKTDVVTFQIAWIKQRLSISVTEAYLLRKSEVAIITTIVKKTKITPVFTFDPPTDFNYYIVR